MDDLEGIHVTIEAPRPHIVVCAASRCGKRLPKHEAHQIKVTYIEQSTSNTFAYSAGWNSPWAHSVMRSYSAGVGVAWGAPSQMSLEHVYVGYACCQEHAQQAGDEKATSIAQLAR